MEILAIIPVRSGSKSIIHKNIKSVYGKPLMAWTIEQACKSKLIDRVIVSTDDENYKEIALKYGAEVPFTRPEEIALDDSTDLNVFKHALSWLSDNEGYRPDICVHLRATSPLRTPEQIDGVIQYLIDNPEADSVRTIYKVNHPPYKMWVKGECKYIEPVVVYGGVHESWSVPRQLLPETYIQTANIDVIKTSVIMEKNSMTGKNVLGYNDENFCDIDTTEELEDAICKLVSKRKHQNKKNTFCFDIDGVIVTLAPDLDYSKALPQSDTIKIINKLYEKGHTIILHTARGSVTGRDLKEFTDVQMKKFGVKFHKLVLGKPAADFYIDDKLLSVNRLEQFL